MNDQDDSPADEPTRRARTRRSGWTVAATLMGLVLLGIVGASFVRSARDSASEDHSPAPPCPAGFLDQVGETDRVRTRLSSSTEGAALLAALPREVRFCFGEIDVPVVSEGRVLILDRRAELSEQAARAGHLLHHVVRGMPYPAEITADTECDAVVETAIEREAEAYALEARLRRAFELPPTRYGYERSFWAAPEAERVGLVGRYLREHPGGARNMDALVSGYAQRCEAERAAARR